MVGVDEGVSVRVKVLVASAVGVLLGMLNSCCAFIEQAESRIVPMSKQRIPLAGDGMILRLSNTLTCRVTSE
jgi:hypothetical protein